MKFFKNKWILLLINVSLSILFWFGYTDSLSIASYIDILFYMSAFYLFFALAMFVLRGGFFDGAIYSGRRFFSRIDRNKDLLEEWQEKSMPSEKINRQLIAVFFWQSFLLGVIMAGLLFAYYG